MLKRLFDIIVSSSLLLLLAPIFILLSLLILLSMGRPIFFSQKRPGMAKVIFEMYKFRTMTDKRGESGELLPDSERLTKVGALIRSSSLDELPSLINVLKGDMSLVGPRPLLVRYLPYYTDKENIRHNVRPGITGWAQVNGRNTTPWEKRFELDVWYVQNASILLDIKILLRTFIKAIKKDGLIVDPSSSMKDFDEERKENVFKN